MRSPSPSGDQRYRFPVCSIMVAMMIASAVLNQVPRAFTQEIAATPSVGQPPSPQFGARELSRAFRNAAKKATPGVVTVLSYGQKSPPRGKPATPEDSPESEESTPAIPDDGSGPRAPSQTASNGKTLPLTGLGSGAIIDPDGLIITNNHVISRAQRVMVQLPDETEYTATAVHGDPDSDVAVIRIESDQPLPAVDVGDSDQLEIGDWVLAIGSPFKLEATVSAGIISAKNRKLKRITRGRLLQTDAAINPGNSGGPLIDLDGNVIAINTAIATRNGSYQGIGFAIPINQADWIARELSEHGEVRRAAIGITGVVLNRKNARLFKLPEDLGILVYQIITGSAAERAGVQKLDVILEFAGERVTNPSELQEIIERKPIGSMQSMKLYRGGEEVDVEVRLAPINDPTAE
ncbi:MAG: trypsin-like peptidase domain-containing protein [Planctomycetota bacterium]